MSNPINNNYWKKYFLLIRCLLFSNSLKLSSGRNSNEPSRISNSQVNQWRRRGTLETASTTIIISTNYRGIELVTSVTGSVWTRVTHAIIGAAREPCNSTLLFREYKPIHVSIRVYNRFRVPATRLAA